MSNRRNRNQRLRKFQRAAFPGSEDMIRVREAELEQLQNAVIFWRGAAECARNSPTAFRDLQQQAQRCLLRAEQLGREIAELKGEEWIDEPPEQELETAGI